jgi:release factor glutamine methyltransferase
MRALFAAQRLLLQRAGVPDAELNALYLLAHAAGAPSRASSARALLARGAPLSAAAAAAFEAACARRAAREPLQYILGEWDFSSLRGVAVEAPTLIPRPETETLVHLAATFAAGAPRGRLLDMCTGSGVVAAALLAALPGWEADAVDVCERACALAARNAAGAGVAARMRVEAGDVARWAPRSGAPPYALLVSNPPYLDEEEMAALAPEVARFEDPRALRGGPPRGLGLALALLGRAGAWLAGGGVAVLETGEAHPALLAAALGGCGAGALLPLPPASGVGRGAPPAPVGAWPPSAAEGAAWEAAAGPGGLAALRAQWEWRGAWADDAGRPRFVALTRRAAR